MLSTFTSPALATTVAVLAPLGPLPLLPAATPAAAEQCVTKSGSATGPTRGFAEYEAELIIYQV